MNIIARSTIETKNTILIGLKELEYTVGATAKGFLFLYIKKVNFKLKFFIN